MVGSRFQRARHSLSLVRADLTQDRRLVRWIIAFCVLQCLFAMWDVPSSFGWENDGIAPRDFFGGLANNILPGRAHRYPLFHYFLVAIAALPALLIAALTADGWAIASLKSAVLSVGTMTAVSITAKLLTIGLSAMAILALASMCRRAYSQSAARWAALLLMTSMTFSYYARTSNLDVPSMAWALLGLERLSAYLETGTRDALTWSAVFCAAAVATKDPAYGLIALPLAIICLGAPWWTSGDIQWRPHLRTLGRSAVAGLLTYGVLSGAFLNPTGFLARIALLTGTNSQDWATYASSWEGLSRNISDIGARQWAAFWPSPVIALTWLALLAAPTGWRAIPRFKVAQRLIPLLLMVSAIGLFTLVARRNDHRFVLPMCFGLAFYGGWLLAWLGKRLPSKNRFFIGLLVSVFLLISGANSLRLVLTQWNDPRIAVESYLEALPEDTVVETYGLVVSQPRFDQSEDSNYRVQRVSKKDPKRRNPLAQTELLTPYMDYVNRKPDILVIPEGFSGRFRAPENNAGSVESVAMSKYRSDPDGYEFFNRAHRDELEGYKRALIARTKFPEWACALGFTPISIHGSTAMPVAVFRKHTP